MKPLGINSAQAAASVSCRPDLQRRTVMGGALAVMTHPWASANAQTQATTPLSELESKARQEGRLATLGMPATWANWGATWSLLERSYGIRCVDTDMSSAEEITKMAAEGRNATADLGDVGFEFAELARQRGITAAYKPRHWEQIPAWAKDGDGHWMLSYTGTMALCIRASAKGLEPDWRSVLSGQWKVCIGELGRAAQANAALLAAAIALGGSEQQLQPAHAAFARLHQMGKLLTLNPSVALMERGEADVYLLWDFNALNYRERLGIQSHRVHIPRDGSVTSGYTTLINRHAPHPHSARLAREVILSDTGQRHLAQGGARPIRLAHLDLERAVVDRLLPSSEYRSARPVQAHAWAEALKTLGRDWQTARNGAVR